MPLQEGKRCLNQQKRRPDVYGPMLVEHVRRKLGERQDLDHRGIVHESIEVAVLVGGPSHDSLRRVGVIEVEAQWQGSIFDSLDVRCDLVEQLDATADQHNIPSGGSELS